MIAGLSYHTIQITLAVLLIFLSGVVIERRQPLICVLLLACGLSTLLADTQTFAAFIGPLVNG